MPSTDVPSEPSVLPTDGLRLRSEGRARIRAFYELTKPGIAGFVMMTAGVSFYVGSAGRAPVLPLLYTLLGTVLATAGALALNQYLERGVDARMSRTRSRPLPSGRLTASEALAFGLLLVGAGCGLLWVTVGALPAFLTFLSAIAYDLVYTPLKSRSYMATFAGAIPGAMPALIGWSAATGEVTLGALVLFAIAFLWQIPHVLALAWILREDYLKAGFYLTPPADPEGRIIGHQMVLYSLVLIPVSLAPTFLRITGSVYLGGALVLGMAVLWWSWRASRGMTRASVRKVFVASLAYQPLLLALMLLDTVRT
jgi:heme o synthase